MDINNNNVRRSTVSKTNIPPTTTVSKSANKVYKTKHLDTVSFEKHLLIRLLDVLKIPSKVKHSDIDKNDTTNHYDTNNNIILLLIKMTQLDSLPPDVVHVLFDVLTPLHDLLNQHFHLHLSHLKG